MPRELEPEPTHAAGSDLLRPPYCRYCTAARAELAPSRHWRRANLGRERVPDETTICKFRHLLEAHELGPQILAAANAHLAEQGFKVSTGTTVDATIISAQ